MSTFKNVSDVDLEVQVDGRRINAPAGGTFEVGDEFDYQFTDQPAFALAKKSAPVVESTSELSSATEGAK